MDRLTSLTVFIRVVDCGGFSAAARRLNMSATMVSNHVQGLEDRLGARLLNRTTRKVSLTDIGKAYYERCTQILADLEDADRIASMEQSTPQGTLRLQSGSHIVRFIAPVIDEFIALYPNVSVDLTVGARMPDLVEEGIDLAIRQTPPPESSLIVRRVATWRHVPCCSPAYLQAHGPLRELTELAQHNCLRFALYPFEDWRFVGPDGAPAGIRVTGNLVATSAELLRVAAVNGRGIFLAPSFIVANDLEAGRLVPLLPQYRTIEFQISAVYPHRHHLSAKVRRFIDLLTHRVAERRAWIDPDIAELTALRESAPLDRR
jgi:DNA-binding transcriptional LysR family regulator